MNYSKIFLIWVMRTKLSTNYRISYKNANYKSSTKKRCKFYPIDKGLNKYYRKCKFIVLKS